MTAVFPDLDLQDLMLNQLRNAIRANQVSFPSQVPTFTKQHRPEVEWQFVQLYFVRGWGPCAIAKRYACSREYVRQVLTQWKRHAVFAGYLQTIPPSEIDTGHNGAL
jgi:hypothetical protein